MKRVGKNSIALGLVLALITLALSFSANGAEKPVAQSEASAITATGLTGIVDSNKCRAESTGPDADGTGTCGTGLGLSGPAIRSFDQTASAGLDGKKGTSTAYAEVAGTDIDALTTIDLSNLGSEVDAIDTGTALDALVEGLEDPALKPLFEAVLTPILDAVQSSVITPLLTSLQNALPVSVEIGAVSTKCTLTAGDDPTIESNVAGINIVVDFPGDNDITIPVDISDVSPNAALVGSVAPQQIVDKLLIGVEDTLTDSLNDTLGPLLGVPLASLLSQVRTALLDTILDQLGPALLDPVGDAISPILDGTVNKQVTNPDGSVEATALSLNVLDKGATLDLARTKCGPNSVADVDNQADANANANANADADAITDADAATNADTNAAADADANADAGVTSTLPNTGAPNLIPLFLLALGLIGFGTAVLANEKRRLGKI